MELLPENLESFVGESALWYYLGRRVQDAATTQVPDLVNAMNGHARDADIPVEWRLHNAIPWATCCRVFLLAKQHAPALSKQQFWATQSGVSACFTPPAFFGDALKQILANVNEPALPGREPADSVADTFAAASMSYTVPHSIAETLHATVLFWVVTDPVVHDAALLAVRSEEGFWRSCVRTYATRRPGWLRRAFGNADRWLFPDRKRRTV
jgi:hypothetical protein